MTSERNSNPRGSIAKAVAAGALLVGVFIAVESATQQSTSQARQSVNVGGQQTFVVMSPNTLSDETIGDDGTWDALEAKQLATR